MQLMGHSGKVCPYINETRFYELNGETHTKALMKSLNHSFVQWLKRTDSELDFNEEGHITDRAPPLLKNYSAQIALVNELLFRRLEQRDIPFDLGETEDWRQIEQYARNYSFNYINGNDSVLAIGCTELFREVTSVFDSKAS
jgi:hypothetical protein